MYTLFLTLLFDVIGVAVILLSSSSPHMYIHVQAHLRSHVALPPLPLLLFLHSLPHKHHFLQLVRQWVVSIGTHVPLLVCDPLPYLVTLEFDVLYIHVMCTDTCTCILAFKFLVSCLLLHRISDRPCLPLSTSTSLHICPYPTRQAAR